MTRAFLAIVVLVNWLFLAMAWAQVPPDGSQIGKYKGLHAAAHSNDFTKIDNLVATGVNLDPRDQKKRTPLHVAAYASAYEAFSTLVTGGANINALEHQQYDVMTISAVKNDIPMLKLAIKLGGNVRAVTSPYDGTALIAAAHLGHVEVVKTLIAAGAPLNHVNNLGWTALIEAVILGDGGPNHIEIVRALVKAGADKSLSDNNVTTPLEHARSRNYTEIIKILE